MTIPTTTPGTPGSARRRDAAMIAVTGSPLVALLGLGAGTASVGQDQQIATKGRLARIQAHGEILAATDTAADGCDVRAELYWPAAVRSSATSASTTPVESRSNLAIPRGHARS